MDVRLIDGEIYRDSDGNYAYISGMDEMVQRVRIACTVPLGSYIYNRALGIDLCDISPVRETLTERLDLRVKEACVNIDNAYVEVIGTTVNGHDVTAAIAVTGMGETRTTEVTYDGLL